MKDSMVTDVASNSRSTRPILLKNMEPAKELGITIGELKLELWWYRKSNAEPYVCLVIESPIEPNRESGEPCFEKKRVQAILNPMRASIVGGALVEWATSLTTNITPHRSPALFAEIVPLTLRFYSHTAGSVPRVEIVILQEDGRAATATLTHLEAGVLAGTLGMITSDDDGGNGE